MNNCWTPEDIDKLIYLVQFNQIIYNTSLPGHSNRNTIDAVWEDIANEFRDKTAKECVRKWNILRGGYRRTRREYSPSDPVSAKKKKWVYFDAMSFLEGHMQERPSPANMSFTSYKTSPNSTTRPDSPMASEYSNSSVNQMFKVEICEDGDVMTPEGYQLDDEHKEVSEMVRVVKQPKDYSALGGNSASCVDPIGVKVREDLSKSDTILKVLKYLETKEKQREEVKPKSSMGLFLESILVDAENFSEEDQMDFKMDILKCVKNYKKF